MIITKDCLIGYSLKPANVKPVVSQEVQYFDETIGHVRVTLACYQELLATAPPQRFILAGIARNRYEDREEALLFDSEFVHSGYKNLNLPLDFHAKAARFLKFLYTHGGSENVKRDINSARDCSLTYGDPNECVRLMEHLESRMWIRYTTPRTLSSNKDWKLFFGVEVTELGEAEVKKSLPQIPMISLVDQIISTGNPQVDEKINHAKDLFFKLPRTADNMRNACETLSYVLEPLRDDLEKYFSASDVSDFFQLVNRFNIRHNKPSTKNLIHEEQLEWVFYTLLNSVNCYVKLKKKVAP